MQRYMSLVLLTLAFISWKPAFGGPPLSAESRLIRAAYVALKANPASRRMQLAYLSAFPRSKDKFLRIFMDAPIYGQLYDGHEYIEALRGLGTMYPARVLAICFGVERKLTRTSDAVAYIAEVTASVGIAHPRVFAEETKRLADADQMALCRFLADEEGVADDPQYERLSEQLNRVGATKLSKKLQQAKAQRLKQPSH